MRRAQPGGPRQGRAEAVPAVRWRRHSAGHGVRAGQHRRPPPAAGDAGCAQGLPAPTRRRHGAPDAGYDYRPCRDALEQRGLLGRIAARGVPTPIQVGQRWVVERTNSWLNDFGRLRRCTERRRACVDAYLALAAAIITVRALCRAAWRLYRWDTRPRSPRIR